MKEYIKKLEDRIVINTHRIILQTIKKSEKENIESTLFCEKDTGKDILGTFQANNKHYCIDKFHSALLSLFFQMLQKHQDNALLASQALIKEDVNQYIETIFYKPLPNDLEIFCQEMIQNDVLAIYIFIEDIPYAYINSEYETISTSLEKTILQTKNFITKQNKNMKSILTKIDTINILFSDYQLFHTQKDKITILIAVDLGKTGYFINKVNTIFTTIKNSIDT